MKTTIAMARKPRNPFVALAMRRRAGPHLPSGAAQRRRAKTQLQRELQDSALHQHSP